VRPNPSVNWRANGRAPCPSGAHGYHAPAGPGAPPPAPRLPQTLDLRFDDPVARHKACNSRVAVAGTLSGRLHADDWPRCSNVANPNIMASANCVHAGRTSNRPVLVTTLCRIVVSPSAWHSCPLRSTSWQAARMAAEWSALVRILFPNLVCRLLLRGLARLLAFNTMAIGPLAPTGFQGRSGGRPQVNRSVGAARMAEA
jgi:hypothetical protein